MSTTYDPEKWKRALDAAAAAIALADEINPDTKKPKYDLYTSADSSLPDDERGRKNYHDTFVEESWNGTEFILAKGAESGIQALQRYGGPRSIKGNMSKGWKTTLVPTMEAVEMYYTKNGLPLDVDPLTKDEDLYSVAPGDNTARLHRNREPRFYASIGFDRGTFEIDDKILTLQLRGGELHGSTLKETDEYQSCTGYLCQKWIHKSSTYNQSKNSYNYRKYAYPYLRLPELFYNYAEADFEYNGSLSPLSLEYLNRVRKRCGLPRFPGFVGLGGRHSLGQRTAQGAAPGAFDRIPVRRTPFPRPAPLEGGSRGDEQGTPLVEPGRKDPGGFLPGDPGQSGRPRPRLRSAEELLAGHSHEPDQQESQPGAEPRLLTHCHTPNNKIKR